MIKYLLVIIAILFLPSYSFSQHPFEKWLADKKTSYILIPTTIATTFLDIELSQRKIDNSNGRVCERNLLFHDGCNIAKAKNYSFSLGGLAISTLIELKYPKSRKFVNAFRLGLTTGHSIGVVFTF